MQCYIIHELIDQASSSFFTIKLSVLTIDAYYLVFATTPDTIHPSSFFLLTPPVLKRKWRWLRFGALVPSHSIIASKEQQTLEAANCRFDFNEMGRFVLSNNRKQ